MVYSSLGAMWMYNGQQVQSASLTKGRNQSASFTYDQSYPGDFSLKLTGSKGQIQMLSVSATLSEGGDTSTKRESLEQQETKKSELKVKRKTLTLQRAKFFKILAPAGGENWELNKTATIYWNSVGIGGELACELFKDRNKIRLISRNISVNKGSYQWKVMGKDIIPGSGYQIRLTTLSDKKSYVSKSFSISEVYSSTTLKKYTPLKKKLEIKQKTITPSEPITLKVISPKYMDKWRIFNTYLIEWESTGLTKDDEIGIALKTTRHKMAKIITITKNTGDYRFQVPYPLIFTGYDIRMIITPLKDRSIEVLSDPFAIMKPAVDLISNSPAVTFEVKRRKRKWWERIGDIFTFGATWYANEVVELSILKATGATLKIELGVIQKGSKALRNVQVDCKIKTTDGFIKHPFDRQTIDNLLPDQMHKLTFSGKTKLMHLSSDIYIIEVFIDPFNRHKEMEQLRENNKITVEFEVK
jgi:hypothetical protein